MFERYTEKARRVIFFSRYEASQFGAISIEAEHILLGVVREDRSLVERFFPSPAVAPETIRREVEGRLEKNSGVSLTTATIDLPLSNKAKQALTFAAEEAERFGHHYIGTEHLLLGLLRVENSIAAAILGNLGLQLEATRERLRNEARASQHVTQRLSQREAQQEDLDEKWMRELSEACFKQKIFEPEELASEFQRVAAMRQFRVDVEALLRLLAAKGLIESRDLSGLVMDFRDERKFAGFLEKLRE
jgi:ATP-dependent Clp protease ATP-binding subunit ClpC